MLLLQVSLTPSEGKRLIGMSVAQMDAVQHALREGIIVVATSTTTGYVLEELLKEEIPDKGLFTAGVVLVGDAVSPILRSGTVIGLFGGVW